MPRLKQYLSSDAFLDKMLHPQEIKKLKTFSLEKRQLEFLAGRIAAKEAYMKSLHQGISDLAFNELEVEILETGATLIEGWPLSISHDGDYCIAVVCYER